MKNRYFRPVSRFIACCQCCDHQVLLTRCRRTVASSSHSSLVALSGGVCWWRETDDEVFMTRTLNVTPKTTKQHLIVRLRRYRTIEYNYWRTRNTARLRACSCRHSAFRIDRLKDHAKINITCTKNRSFWANVRMSQRYLPGGCILHCVRVLLSWKSMQ